MGGTHKSGHAATVAEAGRKAELARDHYEDTKAKELKELDKKEVKLLDELRKSLKTTDSIPNRTSMLMKRIRRGKEEEEEEEDNGGKEGVLRTKTKGRDRDDDREKEEKETMILRDEKTKTKTYVSKADRKRLKKRRREEQQKEQHDHQNHTRRRIE